MECEVGEGEDSVVVWGVGMDSNIVTASLKAVISAINRSAEVHSPQLPSMNFPVVTRGGKVHYRKPLAAVRAGAVGV